MRPSGDPPIAATESPQFEALIREHYARLVTYVARIVGSSDDAEDIVQDLFVRLWNSRTDVSILADPGPYLLRAARNRAVSYLRHERVVLEFRDRSVAAPEELVPGPFELTRESELRSEVEAAVESLPPRCREVFRLSREQGLSHAEIARTLGISVKTVEGQMGKALRVLWTRIMPILSLVTVILPA